MSERFIMDMGSRVWRLSPSKPPFIPPPGARDAHCHVFGPGEVLPYAPSRKYAPSDPSPTPL
jgi:2-pyrone-4,6-dicarboxylate lactonase